MNAKNIIIGVASVMGLGLLLTITGMAASSWIKAEVATQIADQLLSAGIVPDHEVAAIDARVTGNTEDIVRVESKAEQIARILMED